MKHLLLSLLFIVPFIATAQKKESYWQRRKERLQSEAEIYKPKNFSTGFDESGYYMQKAATLMLTGTMCEILGGGVAAIGASQEGNSSVTVAGAVVAGAGLIVQLIGYVKLNKAGERLRKIRLTGTGVSLNL